jgi:hypothetical protein
MMTADEALAMMGVFAGLLLVCLAVAWWMTFSEKKDRCHKS